MTGEVFSLALLCISTLVTLFGVVVKVNRTLVSLEEAVRRLNDHMTGQERRNGHFYECLNMLDKRVSLLERDGMEKGN